MEILHRTYHERFKFKSLAEIQDKLQELNMFLPFEEDSSSLLRSVTFNNITIPNSLAIHPMEGCDGLAETGSPGPLTIRRYKRFAQGGAGLLWMEATAVAGEGRANPHQLWINEKSAKDFKELRDVTLEAAEKVFGPDHRPLLILQLTYSGRYSKPQGKPAPIIAHRSKVLDPKHNLPDDYPLITDEELDALQDRYLEAAQLSAEAGFDGVDIKACHGYLLNELLASHTREGKYGGSYENRVRFLLEVVAKIRKALPDLMVTSRLNVYDAIPYPYGFGMSQDGSMVPDLDEPIRLIKALADLGVELINVAVANPYYNPHVERPYDKPIQGGYIPEEHPLANIAENVRILKEVTEGVPNVKTIVSGISWLRQYFPYLGAALISQGYCDVVGLGRMGFAYPDFVKDLMENGALDTKRVCIACSSCSEIMRSGRTAGCPIRDREIYAPILKETLGKK